MISIYKDIPPVFVSIKPYKLYKTYDFSNTNIGSGSSDVLVFEAISDTSSSSENTDLYRPANNPFKKDSSGYILDYNYTLMNGERYMPVSESRNPNGSVKRLIYKSIKRLFYEPDSVFWEKYLYNTDHASSSLGNSAFMFYIPAQYIAESIEENSIYISDMSDTSHQPYSNTNPEGIYITDDNGFLYDYNNPNHTGPIGNISYDTGHIIITDAQYKDYFTKHLIDSSSTANTHIEITSYYSVTEYEYVCVAGADEFNVSMNPTLYQTSAPGSTSLVGPVKTDITSNDAFRTQITGIGLYDDVGGLVAFAKFAKPIRKQKTLDSIFVVKFDI